MIYYTGFGIENRQTAGAKAPSDILHFCKQRHYQFIGVKKAAEEAAASASACLEILLFNEILEQCAAYSGKRRYFHLSASIIRQQDIAEVYR